MRFHGINYYSHNPERLFEFYKTLGLRVVQERESDDYYGAALALSDADEPVTTFRGGTELIVTDPDGNTVLYV